MVERKPREAAHSAPDLDAILRAASRRTRSRPVRQFLLEMLHAPKVTFTVEGSEPSAREEKGGRHG